MSKKTAKPFGDVTKTLQRVHRSVDRYLEEWMPLMGLSDWAISTTFYSTFCEEDPNFTMMIAPQWEYMQATLKIFLPSLTDLDDRKLEFIVVHELSHCLVSTMAPSTREDHDRKNEEKAVSMIAKALIRAKYSPRPNPSMKKGKNNSSLRLTKN